MKKAGIESLEKFYTAVLEKKGVRHDLAFEISREQVGIQAFGVSTHGLIPLHHLITETGKSMDPDKTPRQVSSMGACEVYDCSGTLSIGSVMQGVLNVGRLADTYGCGFVSLHNTGWIGALGYHLADLARKGFLVMIWVHTSDFAGIAPFGGRDARLSTNPTGYAFPADPDPVVADFSTSATSNGRVTQWIRSGSMAPEEIFLDSDGRPTRDPHAFRNGGAILPAGGPFFGYKGTALSLWIEALSAASGALPANPEQAGGHNAHLFALKVSASKDNYEEMVDRLLEWICSSRPVKEGTGPRIPGMRGWESLARARREGIEIDDKLHSEILRLAREYGLDDPVGADTDA